MAEEVLVTHLMSSISRSVQAMELLARNLRAARGREAVGMDDLFGG